MEPRIVALRDGRIAQLRSARPDDRDAVQRFVRGLSAESRRRRFFGPVAELSSDHLDGLTRARDPRELALVAEDPDATRIVGLAQYVLGDEGEAEFAVVVADDWQRLGLGRCLLDGLAARAATRGIGTLSGIVLAENWPMLAFAAAAGFDLAEDRDPQFVQVSRRLAPPGCIGRLVCAWHAATRPFEVASAR